jgi:hypothetical protein
MRFPMLLRVAGTLGTLFGLGFLFAPTTMLRQYGIATDAAGGFMCQFFGAALLQLGLVLLLLRDLPVATIPRVAAGAAVGELAGLWIAVRIQLGGQVNALGWTTVFLYGLFALAFGSFALRKPQSA